jgi:hypothetical protein
VQTEDFSAKGAAAKTIDIAPAKNIERMAASAQRRSSVAIKTNPSTPIYAIEPLP